MTTTAFEDRILNLYVQELEAPRWPARAGQLLVDALERNPWSPFDEMRLDRETPWRPYERRLAIAHSHRLEVRGGHHFDGSLLCTPHANVVRVSMLAPTYEAHGARAIEAWIRDVFAALPFPSGASARASADRDQMMFIRERDLPTPRLGEIGWLHVVSPGAYDRDALLRAPAYRVEEREEAIWIWVYKHPFHYDTAAARDANAALRRYLRSVERE